MQHPESPLEIRAATGTACKKSSMSKVLFLPAGGQGTTKGSRELVLMLSGSGNKALLPSGLQTAHVKGWKQAGEEKEAENEMEATILDLTTCPVIDMSF